MFSHLPDRSLQGIAELSLAQHRMLFALRAAAGEVKVAGAQGLAKGSNGKLFVKNNVFKTEKKKRKSKKMTMSILWFGYERRSPLIWDFIV